MTAPGRRSSAPPPGSAASSLAPAAEIRRLGPADGEALARFFAAILAAADDRQFHPHPFTPEVAARVCAQTGRDLYYGLLWGGDVLAYGMLRGWDEGFAVPSLGLAVAPAVRGRGLGRLLLEWLHCAARLRGATRVRLTVGVDNTAARRLYESAGYRFPPAEDGRLVGHRDLVPGGHAPDVEAVVPEGET